MITSKLLTDAKLCSAEVAEKWVPFLDAACKKFEINTKDRVAGFLAQCAHESGHFKAVEENLNYGAEGLVKIFGKYFSAATAPSYARQPQKIANRVYANRMGNGDEASKDGYNYRGRGLIQLTGRDNYTRFAKAIDRPELIDLPELVAQPELAAMSAAWFWSSNGLNAIADKRDLITMTKRINGGTIGLEDRQALYNQTTKALA